MGNKNVVVAITNTTGVVRVICLLRVRSARKAAEAFTRGSGGGSGKRTKPPTLVTTPIQDAASPAQPTDPTKREAQKFV